MRLASRIRRLERNRRAQPCPACGAGGPVELRIVPPRSVPFLDHAAALEHARPRPEDLCAACGSRRVVRPFLNTPARRRKA